VLDAVMRWHRDLGVSAARGSSSRCAEVAAGVERARSRMGALVGMRAERVAFTSGATESINLFLRASLEPGDLVLTTAFEHAAVARPLRELQRSRGIRVRVLPPDSDFGLSAESVKTAIEDSHPQLFAFSHASNVTGALFDADAFCEIARQHRVTTLLDASQTAGLLPIDVGADAVACSAHKALLAPPGLGILACDSRLELAPQKQGGTGSSTALEEHPTHWPMAFEAGTPNTPAILGLEAALTLLTKSEQQRRWSRALDAVLAIESRLTRDDRFTVCSPPGRRVPVLSFLRGDLDPAEQGAALDALDVHVRTGHHCSPWIHRFLDTEAMGTVRVSPGPEISADDIQRASEALES
jgi:cysteine desulfurase / selenocysteine lyase